MRFESVNIQKTMKSFIFKTALLFIFSPFFAQSVQSPSTFMGYDPGERFTYHNSVVSYFEHAAAGSDLVKLHYYGETWEKRPLLAAIVTSEDNMKRLEDIRLANLAAAGIDDNGNIGLQIPVIWLSYNIHGNEASATEAALVTLYSLVSGKHDGTENWLDSCIIVIDPSLNPDGREKYAVQYHSRAGKDINLHPYSWQRNQPWPGTRSNHYLYDLNRDWPWQTQTETVQRLSFYSQWMPHVHIDFHEMGADSYYFFPPAAEPQHEVISAWQREFQDILGRNLAEDFDSRNQLYWTGESFDLFSPSYGDTWPTFNGAMGFTYEQGGSGRAGLAVELATGDTLTLADRVKNQYHAGITTIRTAYEQRERLLEGFNSFFARGSNDPPGEYKSYVIRGSENPSKLRAFTELLVKNNIEYAYPLNPGRSYSGFSYLENSSTRFELHENDIVISAYQPHSHLVQVFMEPETESSDTISYDITAWSLPYVYLTEAYAVRERIETGTSKVEFPFEPNIMTADPPYAYLVEWKGMESAGFLAQVLKENFRVRNATERFSISGREFERGTLVITRPDNTHITGFDTKITGASNEHSVKLFTTTTGMSDEGRDLGSRSVRYIGKPDIMVVAGSGTSSTAVGDLWYYFEQVLKYPVTLVDTDNLQSVDLDDFDVVILPGGSYIRSGVMESLLGFARGGGRLIALESAVRPFAGNTDLLLGKAVSEMNERKQREEAQMEKEPEDMLLRYEDRRVEALRNRTSGSIFRVTLDPTHPLAYGIGDKWFVQKRSSTVYPYLPRGGWNVGTLRESSYVAGFAGEDLLEELEHSLVIGTENIGRGDIIYLSDSPLFRGYWYSGRMLFANMLFF